MKRLFGAMLLVLPSVLVACPPPTDTDTAPTTTTGACVCDCPAGPPPPPMIDAFCASAEDGTACCLGPNIGACQAHECQSHGAAAPSPTIDLRGE